MTKDMDGGTTRPEADTYVPPAIERVEDVTGLLGATHGSYCPPKTYK